MGKIALVIGGGAPNYTLMTGALYEFEKAGITFDIISMAGGGALVGLSYLAPKGFESRLDALQNSVNLGVSDPIYRVLPMNYKVFTKAGVAAAFYRSILSSWPGYNLITNQFQMTQWQKTVSDFIQLIWAINSPMWLTTRSTGLCAHAPFIDELVDFEKLKKVKCNFYLNAYCLTDEKMAIFDKSIIDKKHFQASLAYPFIYAPFELDGKLYIEGASRDTFNFKALIECEPDIDKIVVFNAIGIDGLLQPPGGLWDAYGLQMITPLVALAHADLKLFEMVDNVGPNKPKLMKVHFDIPKQDLPAAMTWASSNLNKLFEVGRKAGRKFIEEHGKDLGV